MEDVTDTPEDNRVGGAVGKESSASTGVNRRAARFLLSPRVCVVLAGAFLLTLCFSISWDSISDVVLSEGNVTGGFTSPSKPGNQVAELEHVAQVQAFVPSQTPVPNGRGRRRHENNKKASKPAIPKATVSLAATTPTQISVPATPSPAESVNEPEKVPSVTEAPRDLAAPVASQPPKPSAETSEYKESCDWFLRNLPPAGKQRCKGPYTVSGRSADPDPSAPRRLAYVIRGESFRRNSQMHDRDISVTAATVDCQMKASESQVKYLIEPVESCGMIVDVFIVSWKPEGAGKHEAMKKMTDIFQPRVKWSEWRDHRYTLSIKVNGQFENYNFSLRSVSSWYEQTGQRYDALLVVRSDLIIKRPILNIPKVSWKKCLFMFRMWEQGGGYPSVKLEQRVPETMLWFPWQFANCAVKLGWKEHDFPFLNEHVGFENMGFMMPNEYHDANTMGDRNPLYSQACRKEAKYDVHGGHAYALFNVVPVKDENSIRHIASRFIETFFLQNEPRVVPPQTLVMHSWTASKELRDVLHLAFGQAPQEEKHDAPLKATPWQPQDWQVGWRLAVESMRRTFDLFRVNQEFKYKSAYHPGYKYDRVTFLRLDYPLSRGHIAVYSLDTSKNTFVGFGASKYEFVPVMIMTDHKGAWQFGEWLRNRQSDEPSMFSSPPTTDEVILWLEQVLGKPVTVLCKKC